jgi:hypothetical protein
MMAAMNRIFVGLLMSVGFLQFAWAQAQQVAGQRCRDPEVRVIEILKLRDLFAKIVAPIETRSPSDWSWFDSETEALFDAKNSSRWLLVEQHRMYHPYRVHSAHRKILKEINKFRETSSLKNQLRILSDFIGDYPSFALNIYPYIDADSSRSRPVLTTEQQRDLIFATSTIPLVTKRILGCFIEALSE